MVWTRFAKDWNATLTRYPENVVSTFFAAQSATWLGLYGVVSGSSISSFLPPELGLGWVISRATVRLRKPLNVALAAATIRIVPSLAELKVTPLVTGFVENKELSREMALKRKEMPPLLGQGWDGLAKAGEWLRGPVDKYGLALYLSGRASGVITLCAVTAGLKAGADVPALLAEWGLLNSGSGVELGGGSGKGTETQGLPSALASLATASAVNALFTPIHFATAVYGTHAQEFIARAVAEAEITEADCKSEATTPSEKGTGRHNHGEGTCGRAGLEERLMRGISVLLLSGSFVVTLYAMKVVAKAGADTFSFSSSSDDMMTFKK